LRAKLGLGICAVAFAVLVCAVAFWPSRSHALVAPSFGSSEGTTTCKVGEPQYFGWVGWGARGASLIHFKNVTAIAPAGMNVVGVYAISYADGSPPALSSGSESDWARLGYSKLPLHKVSDATVDPRSPKDVWWIVVKVIPDQTGPLASTGLRVSYTAGGHQGVTTYPYSMTLTCQIYN
jgi:hypothetical protein